MEERIRAAECGVVESSPISALLEFGNGSVHGALRLGPQLFARSAHSSRREFLAGDQFFPGRQQSIRAVLPA